MGCHGEKSTAKYFDLRNEEKKTTGILADGVEKRSGSKKKILQRMRHDFLKQLQDVLLGDSEKHVRKSLEWTWFFMSTSSRQRVSSSPQSKPPKRGAAAAHTTAKPETQPLGDHQHQRQ